MFVWIVVSDYEKAFDILEINAVLKCLEMQNAQSLWMHNRYNTAITSSKGLTWEEYQVRRYISKTPYRMSRNGHHKYWLWREHLGKHKPPNDIVIITDIVLAIETTEQLQTLLTELKTQSLAVGFKMNHRLTN